MTSIMRVPLENCAPVTSSEALIFGSNFKPEMKVFNRSEPLAGVQRVRLIVLNSDARTARTADDNAAKSRYAEAMNDITREEFNAKLETIEVKMDARVQAVSSKIDSFLAAQAERDRAWEKISEARFERIEKDVGSIKADSKKIADEVNGMKVTMAKYLGAAIVIGAVASALLGAVAKNLLAA